MIHHLDHNHFNDEVTNLVIAHSGCHASYHNKCQIDTGTGMMAPGVMEKRQAAGFGSFEAGELGRQREKDEGLSFWSSDVQRANSRKITPERATERVRASHETNRRNGTGCWDPAVRAKGQAIIRERKLGWLAKTTEERQESGRRSGQKVCAQRWLCAVEDCEFHERPLNPLSMGRHQKRAGHAGKVRVESDTLEE